jgi:hypothetical protein
MHTPATRALLTWRKCVPPDLCFRGCLPWEPHVGQHDRCEQPRCSRGALQDRWPVSPQPQQVCCCDDAVQHMAVHICWSSLQEAFAGELCASVCLPCAAQALLG